MSLSAEEREKLRAKFVEYRRTGERKLRNELIEAHKSLAMHLARTYGCRVTSLTLSAEASGSSVERPIISTPRL